jgi:Ser/Thr protein kinase RdoA (MazF antagonist)
MEIFRSDSFSSGKRVFSRPSASVLQDIAETLKNHYELFLIEANSVKEFGGLGVNSKNYLCGTEKGRFVLKKILKKTSLEQYEIQLASANQSGLLGFTMPVVRPTIEGRMIAPGGDGCLWVLSDFFEGDHFTGDGNQISVAIDKIAKFHKALEESPSARELPVFDVGNKNNAAKKTFQDFFKLENQLEKYFPERDVNLLNSHFTIIRRALEISIKNSPGHKAFYSPTHIDLHPHNLLVSPEGEVAIIDYDAVFLTDRFQFVSYAALKLLRQVAHSSGREHAMAGLDLFLRMLELPDAKIAGAASITEVLRRIALVLDLNIRHRNTGWNTVLAMLLSNLREAAVLYQIDLEDK